MSEQTALSPEEMERNLHLTKNRIAAVDITRILAAMLVMFGHLQNFEMAGNTGIWLKYLNNEIIGTCSSVFFLFAGYFACRNITWKKAFDNALWCLLPFLLWVGATVLVTWGTAQDLWEGRGYWDSILGVKSLTTFYAQNTTPINGPLWFMRDLVFLFLLSPLLYRWSKWLFPLIVMLSVVPGLSQHFISSPHVVMSPYSIGFFTLGCYLRYLPKESQQWALKFHSGWYIVVFLLLGLWISLSTLGCVRWEQDPAQGACSICPFLPDWTFNPASWDLHDISIYGSYMRKWEFIPALMSIWAIYQTARYIEVHFPRLTQWALKLAPVTFLTFAAHWSIYTLFYISPLKDWDILVLLPFLVFALMTLFFFALKRWARPLLHLVAHYKLRPDDK